MILRRLFHALPVVALTLFVLVLLNLQLRARNDLHPGAHFTHGLVRSQARSTAKNHHRDDAAADEREPTARSWKETNPESPLEFSDVFIAVKTTGRFHTTRLALLLETWISRTKDHVSVSWTVLAILFMNVSSLSRMLIAVYGNWWCHRMCVRAAPAGWQARAHPVASTGRFVQRSCRRTGAKPQTVPKPDMVVLSASLRWLKNPPNHSFVSLHGKRWHHHATKLATNGCIYAYEHQSISCFICPVCVYRLSTSCLCSQTLSRV